ncbi:MAG TPA: hypothetical protein VFW23_09080 [Tepidisphaeraceae bacterium]|nr:hypothetical protein [Tepidisphaeraceae bacterium]
MKLHLLSCSWWPQTFPRNSCRKVVAAILGLALIATGGCGDLAARRELKVGQFVETGDTRIGKPFEIDSRLPPDWGKVRIVQTESRAGPQTAIEVPPRHDIRILLVPATTTADVLPEPPEMERRDIQGSRQVPMIMPHLPPTEPANPDGFIHRKDK